MPHFFEFTNDPVASSGWKFSDKRGGCRPTARGARPHRPLRPHVAERGAGVRGCTGGVGPVALRGRSRTMGLPLSRPRGAPMAERQAPVAMTDTPGPRITVTPNGPYHVAGDVPMVAKAHVETELGEPIVWTAGPELATRLATRCADAGNRGESRSVTGHTFGWRSRPTTRSAEPRTRVPRYRRDPPRRRGRVRPRRTPRTRRSRTSGRWCARPTTPRFDRRRL